MGFLQSLVHDIMGSNASAGRLQANPTQPQAQQATLQGASPNLQQGGGNINVPSYNPQPQGMLGQHMQQILGGSLGQQNVPNYQGQQNPGYTPMQGSNLNYQQAPQPATFNPMQGSQQNPQQGAITF